MVYVKTVNRDRSQDQCRVVNTRLQKKKQETSSLMDEGELMDPEL